MNKYLEVFIVALITLVVVIGLFTVIYLSISDCMYTAGSIEYCLYTQ